MGSDELMLLDTHSWIWLVGDDPQLNKVARREILKSASADSLFLSPISLWEVALKSSRGRLELSLPLRTWIQRAVNLTGVHLAPITTEIACACAELPPDFHGDPADRIIAATARSEGLTLVTHDDRLLALARRGYFKAVAT
jgi:PIN domain nuclease of toxin-antitoxin system